MSYQDSICQKVDICICSSSSNSNIFDFFSFFDQLLFFSPILVFYLLRDAIGNFILSLITTGILGMVISMNIYGQQQITTNSDQPVTSGKQTIF